MKKSTLYLFAVFLLMILTGVILFNTIQARENPQENNLGSTQRKIVFCHWIYFPNEVFELFSKEYPGIEVDYQRYPVDSYSEIVKNKITSGHSVDLLGINSSDLDDYINNGWLYNLDGKPFLNNYKDTIRSAVLARHNDGEYVVSYGAEYYGIWYNKIIFQKYDLDIPQTYNEFVAVCRTLKNNDIEPIVLGARDIETASQIYLFRISDLMDKDGWESNFIFGSDSFTEDENLKLFTDTDLMISQEYILEESINLTYHQAFVYFQNAKAAMLIAPSSSMNLIKDDFEKVCDPGVFRIPYSNSKNEIAIPTKMTSALIGVSENSKYQEEALLLLEFLSRPDIARIYNSYTQTYPTIKGIDSDYLQYIDLWQPLISSDCFDISINYLSSRTKERLGRSAQYYLAGLLDVNDLIQEFEDIYTSAKFPSSQ